MYQFTSERLGFRTIQRSELPAFVDVYASNRYYLSFFEPDASTDLVRMEKEWDEDSKLPTWSAMGIYCRSDGLPVGFINYLQAHPRLGTPHIGLFIIDRDLHGQGYGTESLEAFLVHMQATQGWAIVRLGVIAQNARAHRFWTSRGFSRFSTAHMELLHGPTEIILMERNLGA